MLTDQNIALRWQFDVEGLHERSKQISSSVTEETTSKYLWHLGQPSWRSVMSQPRICIPVQDLTFF